MNMERPAPEDIPGADGIEVMQRQGDSREENGTGADADEEELDELEDDAEGG